MGVVGSAIVGGGGGGWWWRGRQWGGRKWMAVMGREGSGGKWGRQWRVWLGRKEKAVVGGGFQTSPQSAAKFCAIGPLGEILGDHIK